MSIFKNLLVLYFFNFYFFINSSDLQNIIENTQEISSTEITSTENLPEIKQDLIEAPEDAVDIMFKNEEEIETPEFSNPSKITIFIRHYGIAFLNKYYDIKDWLKKKLGFSIITK